MAAGPPMSALDLRMDDNVVRVTVELHLGVSLCQPHQCHQCGTEVETTLGYMVSAAG